MTKKIKKKNKFVKHQKSWAIQLLCSSLCLCFIVQLSLRISYAQSLSQTFFYAQDIPKAYSQDIAKSILYLQVLQKKYKELATHKALTLGIKDREKKLALISSLYKCTFELESTPTEKNFNLTVKLIPKYDDVLTQISNLIGQTSLIDLRLEWLELLQKNSKEGNNLLSMLFKSNKQLHSMAFASLENKIQRISKRLNALWYLDNALSYFQERWRNPEEVNKVLQKAIKEYDDIALIWSCLGEVQLQLDDMRNALKSLNKALELEQNRARTIYIRGLTYLRLHQPSSAKIDFDVALAIQPNTAAWLRARGATHLVLENFDLMCADFNKACAYGDCDGLMQARRLNHCLPKK